MKTKLLSCTICALILIAFDGNVTAGADENQDSTSGISGNNAESRRQLRLGGMIDEPETNSSYGELPNEPNQTESPEGSNPKSTDTEELGELGGCEVLLPNPGQPRELTGNFWIQEIKYENDLPIIMDEPVPAIDETTGEEILEYLYFVDPANEGEVHWRAKAGSGSGPSHSHPVCYVSGQYIVVQPVIRFPLPALKPDDLVCLIGIRVMRNASGDVTGRNVFTKPTIEENRTLGNYADLTFGVMHSKTKLARKVDLIDPLEIEWYVSVTSGKDINLNDTHPHIPKDFEYAGTTKNRMYVTLRNPTVSWKEEAGFNGEGSGPDNPPIQDPAKGGDPEAEAEKVRILINKMVKDNDITLLETVLDISCRNGKGQETDEEIIKRIWADFEDREVKRRDGELLLYWGSWGDPKMNAKRLPPHRTHNERVEWLKIWAFDMVRKRTGRCGEWVHLFRSCLEAQGVKKAMEEARILYVNNMMNRIKPGRHFQTMIYVKKWVDGKGLKNHQKVMIHDNYIRSQAAVICGKSVNKINITGERTGMKMVEIGGITSPQLRLLSFGIDTKLQKYNWMEIDGKIYADVIDDEGIAAQGMQNPPSYFDSHTILRVGGVLYDPSYGVHYPAAADIVDKIYACVVQVECSSAAGLNKPFEYITDVNPVITTEKCKSRKVVVHFLSPTKTKLNELWLYWRSADGRPHRVQLKK
ncbi:MAG: hypothetical protein H8E27_12700 [Verrucomicrobia subdivision 3 bacterium]|nr:hypothetical protein [Limisphaerales bacterium]